MKDKSKRLFVCTAVLLAEFVGVPPTIAETIQFQTEENSELEHKKTVDHQEEFKLLEILEKHTEIATKTRLNADFVPGMVTVLYGDDLEARGVRTVIEALVLVPGFDMYLLRQGFWLASVRGGTEPLAVGNLKVLIDDIPVPTAFGTDPIPNIPVEQIERIDVIRGPGSAIHGEFASAGVVNIITRKNENRLFVNTGSYDTYGGGGIFSWSDAEDDVSIALNFAGWKSDGASVASGLDTLYGRGMAEISNAPGKSNEMVEHGSAFLTLGYKDFSLNAQLLNNEQGDYLGVSYALPPPSENSVYSANEYGLELRQELDLFSFLHAKFSLGWQQQEFEAGDNYLYPPDYYLHLPTGDTIIYPDGWLYSMHYEEDVFRGGVDLSWRYQDDHDFLLSLFVNQRKAGEVWLETNFYRGMDIPFPIPTTRLDGAEIGFLGGKKRDNPSVTFQDVFALTRDLTLTGSIRYDHYSDIADAISPRLAAVYRLNTNHILKTQYARAFRPPSFWQMYSSNTPIGTGNPNLESVTNDTFEVGYIYKDLNTVFRTTLYYSQVDNMINIVDYAYVNGDRTHYWGSEFELEQQVGDSLKFDANLSYLQTKDVSALAEGVQTAHWYGNAGLICQPVHFLNLALQYRYVGDRGREEFDPRQKLEAQHTVDFTTSLFGLGLRGLTLRAGIKNLFGEDVRHPVPLEEFDPAGRQYPAYPDDLPRPGRRWWCQIAYDF